MGRRPNLLRSIALFVPLLLSSTACLSLLSGWRDTLRYSHARHLKEQVACLDCHTGMDRDMGDPVSRIPDHEGCAKNCHSPEQMKQCSYCHSDPESARATARGDIGIHFAHARHMPRVKGDCMRCHLEIPDADSSEASSKPVMATCTEGCHEQSMAELRCSECHSDLKRYALEQLHFVSHPGGFVKSHGPLAAEKSETCQQCHERSFCSDCHSNTQILADATINAEAATRSFIHPEPFIAIHPMEASLRPDTCASCHRPNFCASCHASFGVASLAKPGPAPHPPGWNDPLAESFHGSAARRDIMSCAGCHDQGAASVCIRCHQVGGSGGNPHPPGFSRPSAEMTTQRMCRLCHWRSP